MQRFETHLRIPGPVHGRDVVPGSGVAAAQRAALEAMATGVPTEVGA